MVEKVEVDGIQMEGVIVGKYGEYYVCYDMNVLVE